MATFQQKAKRPATNQQLEDMNALFGGAKPQYKVSYDGQGSSLFDTKGSKWYIVQGTKNADNSFTAKSGGKDFKLFNADETINAYLADKSQTENLRTMLYNAKYIAKADYATKDLNALRGAIISFSNDYSTNQVTNFTQDNTKYNLQNAASWAGSRASQLAGAGLGPSGTGGPSSDVAHEGEAQSTQDINSFMFEQLGRNATPDEVKQYKDMVLSEENAAIQKSTTDASGRRTTTGSNLNSADYQRLAMGVLKHTLGTTDPETVSKMGGNIGKYISDLQTYAQEMGVPSYSTKDALNVITNNIQPGGTLTTGSLDAEKAQIKLASKGIYKNLSDLIDGGLKVSTLGKQYAYYMGQTLELPTESIDIAKDPYIQKALINGGQQGTMGINDFQIALRNDPRWSKTQNAKEEASQYANNILKTFGLVG
jgi:hypothetical protein